MSATNGEVNNEVNSIATNYLLGLLNKNLGIYEEETLDINIKKDCDEPKSCEQNPPEPSTNGNECNFTEAKSNEITKDDANETSNQVIVDEQQMSVETVAEVHYDEAQSAPEPSETAEFKETVSEEKSDVPEPSETAEFKVTNPETPSEAKIVEETPTISDDSAVNHTEVPEPSESSEFHATEELKETHSEAVPEPSESSEFQAAEELKETHSEAVPEPSESSEFHSAVELKETHSEVPEPTESVEFNSAEESKENQVPEPSEISEFTEVVQEVVTNGEIPVTCSLSVPTEETNHCDVPEPSANAEFKSPGNQSDSSNNIHTLCVCPSKPEADVEEKSNHVSAPEPNEEDFQDDSAANEKEDDFVDMALGPKINENWWRKKRATVESEQEPTKHVDKFRTIKQNIKQGNTRSLRAHFENFGKF